jgi:hypothetical protein
MILALDAGTKVAKELVPEGDDVCTLSWRLWSSSAAEVASIHEAVEGIFSGYSFYPEVEWKRYGYYPPDGHKVLGAWRHPDVFAFVFLLDNPGMQSPSGTQQLILSYSGRKADLAPLAPRVAKLRRNLVRKNGRRESVQQLQQRLDKTDKSGTLKKLLALMGPITAAVNGLAFYLHRLSSPSIEIKWLSVVYQTLLPLVYISSLGLLFAFTVICAAYICKYGYLMLRRM